MRIRYRCSAPECTTNRWLFAGKWVVAGRITACSLSCFFASLPPYEFGPEAVPA
jgi:hypothetical protein